MKMSVIKTSILLLICFSCQNGKEQTIVIEDQENPKNIQLLYEEISKDSIEVMVEYTSALDTIDTSTKNERFTFLYWTKEDISSDEMENIIEKNDKQRMKEKNMKGYNMEDKRSIAFKYKFVREEENYLTVLVEDIAFIRDFEKDSTRIIQKISTLRERVILP